MNHNKYILLALASMFLSIPMHAMDESFVFKSLTPSEGYPSNPSAIVVEDFGYAWIGSDEGLYRIESNGVKSLRGSAGLKGFKIYNLVQDSRGFVWAMTNNGLFRRDTNSDNLTFSKVADTDASSSVYCSVSTPSAIYFGGDNKVYKYVYDSGKFTVALDFLTDVPFRAESMFLDQKGQIILFGKNTDQAFIYVPDTNNISGLVQGSEHLQGLYSAAFIDSNGYAWISFYNKGVNCYDRNGRLLANYDSSNSSMVSNIITCFVEKDGEIWMGTDGSGICVLDPKTGRMNVMQQDHSDPRSFPANSIVSLFCDGNGNVWAGRSSGGIVVVSEADVEGIRTDEIRPFINSEGILSTYESIFDNSIWIGTKGSGLLKFNKNGSFTAFPSTDGLSVNSIVDYDERHLFIVCPARGIFLFDKQSGTLSKESLAPALDDYLRFAGERACCARDISGNIIITADRIYRLNANGTNETYQLPRTSRTGSLHNLFGSGCTLFHDEACFYKWDETAEQKLVLLTKLNDGDHISCAALGINNDIWLSVGGELARMDILTCEISKLPLSFIHTPQSIAVDGRGRVWICSKDGLYVYNPSDGTLVALDEMDGAFPNDYAIHGRTLAKDGSLYLGGVNGLMKINSAMGFVSLREPEISVLEVKLDSKVLDNYDHLNVPQNFNDLFIRFFVRDIDILRTKICRFKVSGPGTNFEEESSLPQIAFHGLRYGTYRIYGCVKAKDGHWTDYSEIYSFRVKSPWYFSWWFISALVLAVAGVFSYLHYRTTRKKARQMRTEANEERLNFLVNVSHELRTPLTLVIGPLGRIINELPEDDPNKAKLNRIYIQANRMKTLLNTILTTNKIKAGASELHKGVFEINSWLANCAAQFNDEASGREMTVGTDFDPSLGRLSFDDNLCQIVFSNLMMNAIKHNKPGEQITVKSELKKSNNMVRVSVIDHGTGLAGVDVSNLFKRFYRVDKDQNGFGIGLSYAKTIIEEHKGSIGAYNNEGDTGATFWFELPVEYVESEVQQESVTPVLVQQATPPEPVKLDTVDVLFVDDDSDLRFYIQDELSDSVKSINLAVNGLDALEKLEKIHVDVVVSDVMMPQMDGLALCRTIKSSSKFRDIPVILLTARADEKSVQRGHEARADFYMPKPFKTDMLLGSIKTVVSYKR